MMRLFLLLSTYYPLLSIVSALSVPESSTKSTAIIWDNVLAGEEQRAALHAYSSKSGLEHKCFSRPLLANSNNNNIIERTLDAILTEIENGNSGNISSSSRTSPSNSSTDSKKQYVEYWTRQEWRHIEAHADVDENLSKEMDRSAAANDSPLMNDDVDFQSKYSATYQGRRRHRYPNHGHVLYLKVGTDVRGPTCVFPGRSSGGDLLRTIIDCDGGDDDDDEQNECSEDNASQNNAEEVQLVTVPAVDGRLLRFDGRDLHAVPRPTDLWMLPFVKGGAQYEPEEVWGRSVILFNVWPGGENPPLDVPLDIGSDNKDDLSSQIQAVGDTDDFCNSFSDWDEVTVDRKESHPSTADSQSNQSVKVWLLGNERRRDHSLRTAPLLAPVDGGREKVREALAEKSQVTVLRLRQQ